VSLDFFPHTACIGLGSNLGSSRKLVQEAWQALSVHPALALQVLSSAYRTKPVAMESSHWFINAVGLLKTSLSPRELLGVLLQVEAEFGRIRSPDRSGYQDRTLDLDLLLFDDLVIDSAELTLPHPAMDTRWFVLIPLAEIALDLVHPLQEKTIAELISGLSPSGRENVVRVDWKEGEQ